MTRTFRSALMAAGLAVIAAPAAAQQGCGDMVDRFAAAQNLTSTAPPVAAPPAAGTSGGTMSDSGPSMSDKLSQSGGVLTPPATGSNQAVIEPPRGSTTDSMPTAPRVAPSPGSGAGSSADAPTATTQDRAAQRAQMESLVTAARAAAARGDERLCMDSLSKAQALAQPGRGTGGGG